MRTNQGLNMNKSVWDVREWYDDTSAEPYTSYNLKPLKALRKALADGADPNEQNAILKAAGSEGSLLQIKALLKAGANLDCLDMEGRSPLHLAVQNCSVEKVVALLKAGIDKDSTVPPEFQFHFRDREGTTNNIRPPEPGLTPSMMAARKGDLKLLDVLRQAGASMDGVLHAAVVGDMEAAWYDDIRRRNGERELTVARLLGEEMDPNAACSVAFDVYRNAGYSQLGVRIGGDGGTPLLMCLSADQGYGYGLPIAEALIAHGADVNCANARAETPLHVVHSAALACRLLEAGADPNAADSYGRTPLHVAAFGGNAEVINELLGAGARPNAVDSHGETPIHSAAFFGKIEAVKALLRADADISLRDSQGLTPRDLALSHGQAETADLLYAHEQSRSLSAILGAVRTESRPVRGYGEPLAVMPRPTKRRL